jgi:hypothetical protein
MMLISERLSLGLLNHHHFNCSLVFVHWWYLCFVLVFQCGLCVLVDLFSPIYHFQESYRSDIFPIVEQNRTEQHLPTTKLVFPPQKKSNHPPLATTADDWK